VLFIQKKRKEYWNCNEKIGLCVSLFEHGIHRLCELKEIVGVHAATDTENEWPWYGKLAGAYFQDHPINPNNVQKGKFTVRKKTIGPHKVCRMNLSVKTSSIVLRIYPRISMWFWP